MLFAMDREIQPAPSPSKATGEANHTGGAWKAAASAAMDRYASGEDAAFLELYDLLEDLLQQTFLQMHHARRHFGKGADVTPWAYAIARRLFIDAFRKRGRDGPRVDAETDEECEGTSPDASPETVLGRRQLAKQVERELARLPEAHRVAFELVQCDGLTIAEAAEALGTTVAAVKLRTHRTYLALRSALGDGVRAELRETLARSVGRSD